MATDASAVDITDSVTKATFDEEKAQKAKAIEENVALKARLEAFESRERVKLQSYQPAMESLVKELATDYSTAETKAHFDSFGDWTRTCHERPNLDTQMQLGTIIHSCASALKRTREDASVQAATSDQLASMAKENESMKEQLSVKEARIGELSTSLKEIQTNSEKLQLQLEKAGQLQEKFDFSKTASREEGAPVKDEEVMKKSTENASKMTSLPQFSAADALASFISTTAPQGNARFMPSDGNHALLSSAHAGGNLMAALRPM